MPARKHDTNFGKSCGEANRQLRQCVSDVSEARNMTEASFGTVQLEGWLARMRAGDRAAPDELVRHVCGRLERLTRHMLRDYPGVHRWTETDDVLQSALLRLLRALHQARPKATRESFPLPPYQIRREMLDLARHYFGPLGEAARHLSA